jgi:hypothetical protein
MQFWKGSDAILERLRFQQPIHRPSHEYYKQERNEKETCARKTKAMPQLAA